jgi:HlyD family secretion protein
MLRPVALGRIEASVANTRAGTVNACRRAHITPSARGQVTHLLVHKGDRVITGQLLLL